MAFFKWTHTQCREKQVDGVSSYQKYMTSDPRLFQIKDIEIERASAFKRIGIFFDEDMSWKRHTDTLSNKLSTYTGILNKLKHYLPLYIRRMLYVSIVNSHLNYGI